MGDPKYVAVDWGTSSFRLWLMDAKENVLAERRDGLGMKAAREVGFSSVLSSHLEAIGAPSALPVIACGMVGAREGWIDAGYVSVPTPMASILSGGARVSEQTREIFILPGLAQRSNGSPDVMRGEETQLLGVFESEDQGDHTVCMPGTHSKWVNVDGSQVTDFATFMTGELFEVVTRFSTLASAVDDADQTDFDDTEFAAAVATAYRTPAMTTNLLFTARADRLLNGLKAGSALARISGTLIGLEIAGALSESIRPRRITLIGAGNLRKLYELAFRSLNVPCAIIDADVAVRRGLSTAANSIWPCVRGIA